MAILKASPASKNILVVDDDEAIRDFLEMLLTRDGFNVKCVANGQDGLKWSKSGVSKKIDLMVLDLMLPDVSGFSVIREIQEGSYDKLPILVITAKAMDKEAERIIREEINVRELIRKPFSNVTFMGKVHAILGTAPIPRKKQDFSWDHAD